MAIASCRPLCQSNYKNAFCQGILPPDKITILCPPCGDPEAALGEYWLLKRTLYGLCCSPRHWYDKINATLCSISLTPSLKDPCLYTGFVYDPSDPSFVMLSASQSLGMYVDNFDYFSKELVVEALFCHLLAERCKVDLWGLLSGSLAFTSHGKSHLLWWLSISISLVLLLTLSRVLLIIHKMRHPRQHCIILGFQLIPLCPPPMWMTLLCRYLERRLIRASLAALVGCHLLHALTLLWPTSSYLH